MSKPKLYRHALSGHAHRAEFLRPGRSPPAPPRLVYVFGADLDHGRALEIAHGVLAVLDA